MRVQAVTIPEHDPRTALVEASRSSVPDAREGPELCELPSHALCFAMPDRLTPRIVWSILLSRIANVQPVVASRLYVSSVIRKNALKRDEQWATPLRRAV